MLEPEPEPEPKLEPEPKVATQIERMKMERQQRLDPQRQYPQLMGGATVTKEQPPEGLTKIEQMKWRRLHNVQNTRENLAGAEGAALEFVDAPSSSGVEADGTNN